MGYRSDIEELRDPVVPLLEGRIEALEGELTGMTTVYTIRYDQDADPPTFAYLGQALPGTAESEDLWRIQKLVFSVDGDVTTLWAEGTALFDKAWDDRAGFSYS